jgi:hypothetical protein
MRRFSKGGAVDKNTVEAIANECGLALYMYGPVRVVKDGEGLKYKASTEITPFGENLLNFADAIEKHIMQRKQVS